MHRRRDVSTIQKGRDMFQSSSKSFAKGGKGDQEKSAEFITVLKSTEWRRESHGTTLARCGGKGKGKVRRQVFKEKATFFIKPVGVFGGEKSLGATADKPRKLGKRKSCILWDITKAPGARKRTPPTVRRKSPKR